MAKGKNFSLFFKTNQIIKRYRDKHFCKIPERKLIDVIPKIKAGYLKDELILETWEQHFRSIKIPYVIVEIDGIKSLWKERVVF